MASTLLMMPELFHYWLCGIPTWEWTEATTTQCYDPLAADWAWSILNRLGLPAHLFGDIAPSGTVLGPLRAEVAETTALAGTSVIAAASHDTASAIAGVPFQEAGAAYVSCGTWSIVGVEVPQPVINDRSFAARLTNEGGPDHSFQLMSNLTGLWLLQECQRKWLSSGHRWELPELLAMAEKAPPLRSLVDPNHPAFAAPGDAPASLGSVCRSTGQPVPRGPGEVVRCVLESLVLAHRQAIELLVATSGKSPPGIHIVGGGSLNKLLCQWTADATGLPVWAGPSEASEIGNLVVQAVALGELASMAEARSMVRDSFPPVLYEPGERQPWDAAYARFTLLSGAPAKSPSDPTRSGVPRPS